MVAMETNAQCVYVTPNINEVEPRKIRGLRNSVNIFLRKKNRIGEDKKERRDVKF